MHTLSELPAAPEQRGGGRTPILRPEAAEGRPNSEPPKTGFAFTPAPDRQLRVFADCGEYHPQPEWCEDIPHPVEQSRGQTGSGDAYSPGWFELPLPKGASVTLVATAENDTAIAQKLERRPPARPETQTTKTAVPEAGVPFAVQLNAPRSSLSSAAAKARPSSPVIRGFWIGGATR
jgi:hypothetical protein